MHPLELEMATAVRPTDLAIRAVSRPSVSPREAALVRLQAAAGNHAVSGLFAHAPVQHGPLPAVQGRWETKYTLSGISKHQQQLNRGGRHFWQTVGKSAVGLRADVNARKLGAGVSSGGHHAEDELITALTRLAQVANLAPNANNTLTIRKLDATPCTSTPRTVWAPRRRKVVRKVKSKSKYSVKIRKRRIYVPDKRRTAVPRSLSVVTSQKTGGVHGCTERLIELKRNGLSVGGQAYGFQQITIEANNYYQGGPSRSQDGKRIGALERIAASKQAADSINAEPNMSLTVTSGAIGKGKGRR